jgi:RNA polymerase sigma-70 factor (ECF subfamily)
MACREPERDPLVALRAGDPAPFEEFVRERTRTLVAYFRQRGAGLERAEDLAQEVFLKLYQSAERYEPRERFAAYCFRTARNVWIDDRRRAAARARAAPASEVGLDPVTVGVELDPAGALHLEEEEHGVRALLGALQPGQRRVLELVLLAELTYAEIGALLSIPVGTVKSRMFHAVRRLRGAWEERHRREGVA